MRACSVPLAVGLIAERSVPKTGGLQGIYREKLLESGAWPLLAEAVTETSFETARLEESVAAALMYLAAEVPYIITRGLFSASDGHTCTRTCLTRLLMYDRTHTGLVACLCLQIRRRISTPRVTNGLPKT